MHNNKEKIFVLAVAVVVAAFISYEVFLPNAVETRYHGTEPIVSDISEATEPVIENGEVVEKSSPVVNVEKKDDHKEDKPDTPTKDIETFQQPNEQKTATFQTMTSDDVGVACDEEREQVVESEPTYREDNYTHTRGDAIDIAKVLYAECRGIPSKTEQACVAWTILNRVDCYDSDVYSVVRSPNQYAFYEDSPVTDELLDLANDVLDRWESEKAGDDNVGRVLPKEYTFFYGDGEHNYFRDDFDGDYNTWDYSLSTPYDD